MSDLAYLHTLLALSQCMFDHDHYEGRDIKPSALVLFYRGKALELIARDIQDGRIKTTTFLAVVILMTIDVTTNREVWSRATANQIQAAFEDHQAVLRHRKGLKALLERGLSMNRLVSDETNRYADPSTEKAMH